MSAKMEKGSGKSEVSEEEELIGSGWYRAREMYIDTSLG